MLVLDIPFKSSQDYSEQDLKIDLALLLYQKRKISLAKAAEWCGLTRLEFQSAMSKRDVTLNYSVEDLRHDVAVLDNLFDAR